MSTPPLSPPNSQHNLSNPTSRKTRQATRLRSLTRRDVDQPRPTVNVNPSTGRASGNNKEKFHSYLGVVARDKIPIVHSSWDDVPETLKNLIWEDILGQFEIPEAEKAKKKILSSVCTRWRSFKSLLTTRYIYAEAESQNDKHPSVTYGIHPQTWEQFVASRKSPKWQGIRKKAQEIQKNNECPHILSRGGYDLLEKKLMDEKVKQREQDAMNTENSLNLDDPPSPIPRHVKWKMARTKKYGHMTSNTAKEIADKIDLLQEQVTDGRFVPQGQHDILNVAIGRPEHPGRVRVAGAGVTITQYFGRSSCSSSRTSGSMNPEQLAGLMKDLKEELRKEVEEESKRRIEKMQVELEEKNEKMKNEMEDKIKMTQKLVEAIKTELTQMATQKSPPGDAFLQELAARVSTKGSGVETTVKPPAEENAAVEEPQIGLFVRSHGSTKLVALGKVYGGSSSIHHVIYADDVVRVTVEEIYDGDALIPYPTSEITYVRESLNTFLAWPKYLVKPVSQKDAHTSSGKKVEAVNSSYNLEALDPLDELMKIAYEVYHRPIQLSWEGFKFGIAAVETSFFITHSDINEIISGDKYLNISILQLWIMFLDEWSTSLGYSSVYGFCEPQMIHNAKDRRSECQQYIQIWVKESQRQVYVGAYLNNAHWQLFVVCPSTHTVVWFCSLRKKPDIHIKGVLNNALKALNTDVDGKCNVGAPNWIELKSHVQTGGFECGYYVMHWMWNIVSGGVKNEWTKCFSDGTSLHEDTITTLRKKWASFLLESKNKAL